MFQDRSRACALCGADKLTQVADHVLEDRTSTPSSVCLVASSRPVLVLVLHWQHNALFLGYFRINYGVEKFLELRFLDRAIKQVSASQSFSRAAIAPL